MGGRDCVQDSEKITYKPVNGICVNAFGGHHYLVIILLFLLFILLKKDLTGKIAVILSKK
jgi:hypothetical protein